jgi:hypothetical protein
MLQRGTKALALGCFTRQVMLAVVLQSVANRYVELSIWDHIFRTIQHHCPIMN